jgi:hypothetical protein
VSASDTCLAEGAPAGLTKAASAGSFATADNIKNPAAVTASVRAKAEKRFAMLLMRVISLMRAA